ncbi:MAG: 4-hydroxy-tetrahydrodipicolinate synthase [Spirochaetaceae bacterium]|jgi:4-hydroxy-tetrahydrodipicolinate synthase|nr:4-hydroxy-tetrahydrodipicolinate synthase [Spirochaetaceae bacterium]
MVKLAGTFTALITPLKDDGTVDYDGWRQLIEFQLEQGVAGLVPLGTTGETPTLDDDEEERLIRIAVGTVKGKVPLVVGTGSNSTRSTLFYTRRAQSLGADAVLITTPYYNKPNDSGLLKHFEAAAAVDVPIVVYNIPGRTGRNIPATLMKELMQFPQIIGVKEASGDINQIGEVIDTASKIRPDFQVISGDDGLTLPVMALGGTGVISVVSNLIPQKMAAFTGVLARGDYAEGRRLHFELLPLFRATFVETNPVPIKAAMNMAGLPAGPVRPPLGPLSVASEKLLRETLVGLRVVAA